MRKPHPGHSRRSSWLPCFRCWILSLAFLMSPPPPQGCSFPVMWIMLWCVMQCSRETSYFVSSPCRQYIYIRSVYRVPNRTSRMRNMQGRLQGGGAKCHVPPSLYFPEKSYTVKNKKKHHNMLYIVRDQMNHIIDIFAKTKKKTEVVLSNIVFFFIMKFWFKIITYPLRHPSFRSRLW